MKIGDTVKLQKENYTIIKEFIDIFLVVSEYGINFKRVPKLLIIK